MWQFKNPIINMLQHTHTHTLQSKSTTWVGESRSLTRTECSTQADPPQQCWPALWNKSSVASLRLKRLIAFARWPPCRDDTRSVFRFLHVRLSVCLLIPFPCLAHSGSLVEWWWSPFSVVIRVPTNTSSTDNYFAIKHTRCRPWFLTGRQTSQRSKAIK